jgi:hypothetical protein
VTSQGGCTTAADTNGLDAVDAPAMNEEET